MWFVFCFAFGFGGFTHVVRYWQLGYSCCDVCLLHFVYLVLGFLDCCFVMLGIWVTDLGVLLTLLGLFGLCVLLVMLFRFCVLLCA